MITGPQTTLAGRCRQRAFTIAEVAVVTVILGILLALLGFYKLMFSTEEKAVSDGTKYVIY